METVWIVLGQLFFLYQAAGSTMNVAMNKPASMSSALGGFPASKAVDGRTDDTSDTAGGIIHTAVGKKSAWWKVDLEREVQDATVEIYFRTDYKDRRNGVQLYTSTTPFSSYPGGQLCHTVSGRNDGTDIPDVVSVTCHGRWRYLLVYTQTDTDGDGPVLDFGEVKVLVCSAETYGVDCDMLCSARHCINMPPTCERDGRCPGGCQDRWVGSDCSECPTGTFGVDCTNCSRRHCLGDSDCPPDGTCSKGCADGWTLRSCTLECPAGRYGPRCSQTCGNCSSSHPCDHVTGRCKDGCQPGWRSDKCDQVCTDGSFGPGCSESCSRCRGPCDVVDGSCPRGCTDGYCGTNCQHSFAAPSTGISVTTLIGALIGAVVGTALLVVAVCAGILLCLMRQGRLLWVKRSNEKTSTELSSFGDNIPSCVEHAQSNPGLSNDYAVVDST